MDCLAIEERGPGLMNYHGLWVALPHLDVYGTDVIGGVVKLFSSEAIISLFDPWVLSEAGFSITGKPWYAWFPVDQEKPPYHLREQVKHMAKPVVYSQYAAERIKGAVVIEPPINTDIFIPGDKLAAKRFIGMEDTERLVGLVGSNIVGDRKALYHQVKGFAKYAKGRPEIKMLLVTEPRGFIDLVKLVNDLEMQQQIFFIEPFTKNYNLCDNHLLANTYRAFDVLLHASAAEGFGMCIAEAMACGTPVIYTDNTSQPEATGGLGYAVRDMEWRNNPHGGRWQYPTVDGVAGALEAWESGAANWTVETLRAQAERFAPAVIAAKWQEVLG